MNKEEIEEAKECLNEVIQNTYAEGKAIKLDYLRKYIESLELTLEQKESILDKVTKFANKIATENAEKYNSEKSKRSRFFRVEFSFRNIKYYRRRKS